MTRSRPAPRHPRTRVHPGVYRRRRIGAAVVGVASLWVTLTGCQSVLDWLSGENDPAEATETTAPAPDGDASAAAEACPSDAELYGIDDETPPADLLADVDQLLAADSVAAADVSMSVWVEGWGEIVAHQPDLALKPASNQKILVAVGALELLPHERRFDTELRATAPVDGATIDGDLVLVGNGDPTLWDVGEHSVYEIAVQLRELGVTRVTGDLYVDESRFDSLRIAQGWTDQQIPGDAAPISALTVRANRLGDDYEYLADPAIGNAEVFLGYLADQGIRVDGDVVDAEAPEAPEELVTLHSPTVVELVDLMLRNSDNTTAELLLKEIGRETTGEGSTRAGLDASRAVVEGWCVPVEGHDDDGSGLSYENARSAREWRQLTQVAQQQPWWPQLYDGLPVAGDGNGTLAGRLTGDATAGNLRAKTGTINVARALTGVFTTAGGRQATFSVIANADDPTPATGPTDQILELIAASTD